MVELADTHGLGPCPEGGRGSNPLGGRMKLSEKYIILSTVFFTGAAVLVIEIAAFRILAPYFGNTLFSTSSIIGVVLGALSLGYWAGGVIADKYPSRALFFFLILLAGIFSLLIQVLRETILELFGYSLDIILGPLIMSVTLFFVPSMILGMMSPFAITLLAKDSLKIGRVSGSVFFWSTTGSIIGSFAAGFFLIPHFGISIILFTVGLFLVGIGGAGSLSFLRKHPTLFIFCAAVFAVDAAGILSQKSLAPGILYENDGLYHLIRVREGELGERPATLLTLDRDLHGAWFKDAGDTPSTYLDYFEAYKLINPRAARFLFIGGGAYIAPRNVLEDFPENDSLRLEVVEIEPGLKDLAERYFGLPPDPRLLNVTADGRRYLVSREDGTYDVIFGDAYSSLASPPHLVTKEFFELASRKLSSPGVFIGNFVGSLDPGRNTLLASEIKTFQSVFSSSYFFAIDALQKEGLQNILFMGIKDGGFGADPNSFLDSPENDVIVSRLLPKRIDPEALPLEEAYVFRDDFVPIEYLTATNMFP